MDRCVCSTILSDRDHVRDLYPLMRRQVFQMFVSSRRVFVRCLLDRVSGAGDDLGAEGVEATPTPKIHRSLAEVARKFCGNLKGPYSSRPTPPVAANDRQRARVLQEWPPSEH